MGGFDGVTYSSTGELLLYFVLLLLSIPLLPLLWIALILLGPRRFGFKEDSMKFSAKGTGVMILSATKGLFSALCPILSQLAIRIRKSLAANSRPRRGRTALRREGSHDGTIEDSFSPRRPYRYQSLGVESNIRLLDVYPGSFGDAIRGEIVIADLSSTPAYDALSYTWADETGDTERSKEIWCVDDDSVIRITKNCEAAIQRLRLPSAKRRVWIDAICINQDSDTERDHQVSLMSRIYVSARQIVVYTGEATSDTDLLYDWLNELDKKEIQIPTVGFFEDIDESELGVLSGAERFWNELDPLKISLNDIATAPTRLWNTTGKNPDQKIALSNSQISRIVSDYFERRWFKRVWVLQEATLPDVHRIRVICGTKATTGERALHLCSLLQNEESLGLMRIFVLVRKRVRGSKRSYLLDILIETRNRGCTDPRDKIFGVLSIARGLDKGKFPELKANYGQSASTVFTNYSAFLIRHHGPSFFLSLIKAPPKQEGLPSWAADWSVPWPNYRAIKGRDFPAGSRSANISDGRAAFSEEGGREILTLDRPRILQGYFTRNGHIDDSDQTHLEEVQSLPEDEVLIEMYPGLSALLKKDGDCYVFVRICPHALSESGVMLLIEMWSRVVLDGEYPEQCGYDARDVIYLSSSEVFKIR
ncbi:hypothetical protein SLS60_000178 [Paraconiothyrium brasiliense]|uniref:Heterokaryon incompatibility domain-containing protein n=1 Tax=Paraconiothyrium brasiliense TaxID=300254 RepID=A0ABR3S5L0_9PLEO